MEERPNYYAVIPANVRYNEKLNSSQKLFFGEITALTQKSGECWASNSYFANLYKVSTASISNWVKTLEKEQLISIEYIKNGKEIEKRIIKIIGSQNTDYVVNLFEGGIQKTKGGYSENLKENNTSINNININNKENNNNKLLLQKKPTLEEIQEYCKSRNNNIDPVKFYEYYSVNDWKDKENKPIKNWKQKIITWEGRNTNKQEDSEMPLPKWFNQEQKTEREWTEDEKRELEELIRGY